MDASDEVAVCELSSLDDWAMLELMDRMPLGKLLLFGQTCKRYKQLAERNLSVRRQLGLAIGCGNVCSSVFKFNSITVVEFDRLVVERILELLPGITSLEIINNSNSSDIFDELLYLLEGWIDHLELLNVWLMHPIEPSFTALPLFGLFNRMYQLKKLHFYYFGSIAYTDWTALHLPVISQLQKFSISINNNPRQVLHQLCTHATDQLAEVDLWCPFYDLESSILLLNVEPHLANRFNSLYLLTRDFSFDQLATIFQMYTSLRIVSISLHLLTVGQLNRAMAMLHQLTNVVMHVNFPRRSAARQAEDAVILLGEEVEPDTVDGSQLVPLFSVTKLKLILILANHVDFEMLHLGALFPKLVQLRFCYLACRTCGYVGVGNLEAKRRCLLQVQSKATFSEMFPELSEVMYSDETLTKEDWHPEPPMPRPLLYFVVAYFCVIICRQVGRQLIGAATGQVVVKTASQGLLAVAKKTFQLVRHSMLNIIRFACK